MRLKYRKVIIEKIASEKNDEKKENENKDEKEEPIEKEEED